jgi:hypothetical protein
VQDALFALLSTHGERVAKEVALASAPDSELRPADLLLHSWQLGGPTAVDITVAHGWSRAASESPNPPGREKWRSFLRQKEEAKHAKYDAACTAEGWSFQAFAVGTWVGLGPEGARFLAKMLKGVTAWQDGTEK